jgi:hypothetical protein
MNLPITSEAIGQDGQGVRAGGRGCSGSEKQLGILLNVGMEWN